MIRLEQDLAAIPDMGRCELSNRWEQMRVGAPPLVPPSVLRRLLAQHLQERRHGGLPALVRRELLRIVDDGDREAVRPPRPRLVPGTRLVREWNEQTISVDVLEEGFAYDNRTWRSLSEIARHVTGAHWSGPRFFGLTING